MSPEDWKQIQELFDAARDLDPEGQGTFLAHACGGDEALRSEVQSLLAAHDESGGFIERAASEASQGAVRLRAGTRLGPYEILTFLEAGGMGEVYRGRDVRLARAVAIKLLPASFAVEPDRLRRFDEEARAVAALNHPNIVALHDLGTYDGCPFLVLELLEGESLRARLERGPLPPAAALDVARQIARGLVAAHDKGILHRDLKPENLFLTSEGALKILDFGLAKSFSAEPPTGDAAGVPTPERTRSGMVLGTAGYMSPEQVRGLPADARSDIFSFGAILYEMLTGRRAFPGPSSPDALAAILREDPPLPEHGEVVPGVNHLVAHCLEKDPHKRFQSAQDLLFAVEQLTAMPGTGIPGRNRTAWIVMAVAGALLLAAVVPAVRYFTQRPDAAPAVRFEISPPPGVTFIGSSPPALSPDGEQIAFAGRTADGRAHIWVRSMRSVAISKVAGSDGFSYISSPFWSPDGRQLAFLADERLLRVDLADGSPVTIGRLTNWVILGGSWSRDGVILISVVGDVTSPIRLFRVAAAGGEPTPLGELVPGESGRMWPQFLPDGRRFLYYSAQSKAERSGTYAAELGSSAPPSLILSSNFPARYADSGHLLFMRGSTLMAQRFDATGLALQGEPVPIAEGVGSPRWGGWAAPIASFSVSSRGSLAWRAADVRSEMAWLDRGGKRLGSLGDLAQHSNPTLSPDETRLAVDVTDPRTNRRDIWVFDLKRGSRTRLTSHPGDDFLPVWSPDGGRIAFSSDRQGVRDLYVKTADGTEEDQLLFASKDPKHAMDWTPDGRFLVFNYRPRERGDYDLSLLPLTGPRVPVPLISSNFFDDQAQVSPDGRWIAYRSYESGRSEVYVRPFSSDGKILPGRWQVSTDGGGEPGWRRDGKELFYLSPSLTLMAVNVKAEGGAFVLGIPKALFKAQILPAERRNRYVATHDGQRFLVLLRREEDTASPIQVLVNWAKP